MVNEDINPKIICVDAEHRECVYSNKLTDCVHQDTHVTSTLYLSGLSPCCLAAFLEGEGRTFGRN